MRILYLVNGIRGSGGLERVLTQKSSYLAEEYGHSIRILVLNEAPGRPFYPISPAVGIGHFSATGGGFGYLKSYLYGVRQALAEFQPDVLVVCDDGMKAVLLPALLGWPRPPMVYERHASIRLSTSWWKRWIMRRLLPGFDRVVALTPAGASEWPGARVEVIPNARPPFEDEAATERLPQLLCVGSLSWNKGYDLLIDAWARIAARHPDWSMHVYGKGDPGACLAQANALGVGNRIQFHPPVPDIESKYREAGLLVLPSRSEGFGMVLIEAMSCGLPCVAFDCPTGPGDILSHGKDGWLVPAQDVAALALAMEQLIEDRPLRESLGQAGLQTASKYDIREIGPQWHALFTSLAGRNVD